MTEFEKLIEKSFSKSDRQLILSFLTMAKLKNWSYSEISGVQQTGYMFSKGNIRLKMILDCYGKYKGKHRSIIRFAWIDITDNKTNSINTRGDLTNSQAIEEGIKIL